MIKKEFIIKSFKFHINSVYNYTRHDDKKYENIKITQTIEYFIFNSFNINNWIFINIKNKIFKNFNFS